MTFEYDVVTMEPGSGEELISASGLKVRPEWIDYNGHMNVAFYVLAFDTVVEGIFELIGVNRTYRDTRQRSLFALEAHVTYQRELHEGDPLRATVQFLGSDDKRVHTIYHLYHAEKGYLAATAEWLQISIDMRARRAAPFEPEIAERIAALVERHRGLPWPAAVGRVMGVKGKA